MHKAVAFLAPKKTRKFEEFYEEWVDTLNDTLLPVLKHTNADITAALLASHVDRIHQHFQSYYTAMDAAAISSPHRHLPLLLHPPWLSPLQVPFLFLGDLHPFLFTALLRSFILDRDDYDDDWATDCNKDGRGSNMKSSAVGYYPEEDGSDGSGVIVPDMQWRMAAAWKRPSGVLKSRMDEIERWVRLMVPDLMSRFRGSQHGFAERLSKKRRDRYKDEEGEGVEEAVGRAAVVEMKEMLSVFVDANRLRRSVLAEIVSATDVYQAAAFFKALAQFLVGLRDKNVLEKLEQCMVMLR